MNNQTPISKPSEYEVEAWAELTETISNWIIVNPTITSKHKDDDLYQFIQVPNIDRVCKDTNQAPY